MFGGGCRVIFIAWLHQFVNELLCWWTPALFSSASVTNTATCISLCKSFHDMCLNHFTLFCLDLPKYSLLWPGLEYSACRLWLHLALGVKGGLPQRCALPGPSVSGVSSLSGSWWLIGERPHLSVLPGYITDTWAGLLKGCQDWVLGIPKTWERWQRPARLRRRRCRLWGAGGKLLAAPGPIHTTHSHLLGCASSPS